MAKFGRVEVKSIKATKPRSSFSEVELDRLADQILNNEGALRPVIVKQIDYENYELLDGLLTYYAAVRAYEKDSHRGEMVNAFVVGLKEDVTLAKQQIAAFDEVMGRVSSSAVNDNGVTENQHASSAWITSFETRLSDHRNEAESKINEIEARLRQIEKAIEKPYLDLLDMINSLPEEKLLVRLAFYGADKAKAEAISQSRQSKADGKFASYEDLLKSTKGLAERGLLSLIDQAHRHIHNSI